MTSRVPRDDMHDFWTIPELVQVMVGLLGKGDQARLSQVCQRTWPAATSILWENIEDPGILLRLLPDSLQSELLASREPGFTPD